MRRLGQKALADLFGQINKDRIGDHSAVLTGSGHDREETTKAYEYGDPLNLHLSTTVHNAVRRRGSGVPVRLTPEDFEVVEVEAMSRSATVLCVDLSMSMPMRDNFVPAKRMAMALQTLISSKFPRDYLGIIGFSEVAREIRPDEIPTAMWDYVYGTNLQHALALSRRLLAHQHGTKQIIVVTDGEPTAHIDDYGEVTFNYPPIPETLRRTMAEVIRCTRAGIVINTFALDLQRTHYPFVEQIARVNGGRTFYTTPDALGRLRPGRLPPAPPRAAPRRLNRHAPAHSAEISPPGALSAPESRVNWGYVHLSTPPPQGRTHVSCPESGFGPCTRTGHWSKMLITSL